jgi:hypothetical protein
VFWEKDTKNQELKEFLSSSHLPAVYITPQQQKSPLRGAGSML